MAAVDPNPPASAAPPQVGARSPWRWVAVGALVAAALAVGWLLTDSSEYRYRLLFADAGQLVVGDTVRVGGSPVGTVSSVDLADNGQAQITVTVSDDFAPLHEGTSATIRAQGLVGVASRYVDLTPGPNFEPKLSDDAVVGSDHTESLVEIDQLFNTLDEKTRNGLRGVVRGFADWYRNKEVKANESARYFGPSINATSKLFAEIDRDSSTFARFLVDAGTALDAATRHDGQLTDLVSHTRRTVAALGSDNRSLSRALVALPPALLTGSQTFARLRPALTDLQALVDATGPATKKLAPFLARLRPVLTRGTPTFAQLRRMLDRPGPHNDIYEALGDLPPLDQLTQTAFPNASKALTQSTPVFSFARPYVPDLTAWVSGYAAALAPYDANGHYARTSAVFDAYHFEDDGSGGHLVWKDPAKRGTDSNLSTGQLRRCPGSASSTPDNSGNWQDNGPLANSDCDPADAAGAAR